ncbi:MAG TPA: hypothetical protein VFN67_35460 [Polyangiales bacterium]|jgi:hypothetical protein|nr:hypothetical protein [Polyangiales bacterium]
MAARDSALLFANVAAMLTAVWQLPSPEKLSMGDKSPKSKQREQKQKQAVKSQSAASAKAKQDNYGSQATAAKGKK